MKRKSDRLKSLRRHKALNLSHEFSFSRHYYDNKPREFNKISDRRNKNKVARKSRRINRTH